MQRVMSVAHMGQVRLVIDEIRAVNDVASHLASRGSLSAPPRPTGGEQEASARAAPASDVTGWCVSAGGGSEPPKCSRRDGCTHAPGAAEYCTLVGDASDADSDGDASPSSAEPGRSFPCDAPGCEYLATRANRLEWHKRTHSGERPYACDTPGCDYRAARAGNLE
ncbi:hypothetical protein T492DRAFT_868123, partial [Pavlovales sp. CCMP2436]